MTAYVEPSTALLERMGAAERTETGRALALAEAILRVSDRSSRLLPRWPEGQVPLAAAAQGRFPVLWVVPSLELGRAVGRDVTAWLVGYEGRAFLRLVNAPPGPAGLPSLWLEGGAPVRAEYRVRPELPFALDELAADCVYELLPGLDGAPTLYFDGGSAALPGGGYGAETERPIVRESWEELMAAYTDVSSSNPAARRRQLASALERLLFTPSGEPRRLRPWALLNLQGLSAEILRGAPRRAREFGLGRLRAHPQCFPSLARRLPKERDAR